MFLLAFACENFASKTRYNNIPVHLSHSLNLNSLKGGYIGDYIGDYYRAD